MFYSSKNLKDYIKIITTQDSHVVHKSLAQITKELPCSNFIRVHRSYTIALDKIKSVEGNLIEPLLYSFTGYSSSRHV
ncbi:LytTR family transcriptional regulator [Zobellia galactanivorans]|nr:LytTR family transcriptional regulator [Zobellia galactanivorans]